MTLPSEEVRAVEAAREFLSDLCDRSKTPGVPAAVRTRARNVLKHFPWDIAETYRRAGKVAGSTMEWFLRRTREAGKK